MACPITIEAFVAFGVLGVQAVTLLFSIATALKLNTVQLDLADRDRERGRT